MKRTLLLILALCLLLTGCGVPGEADTQSSEHIGGAIHGNHDRAD